MEIIDSLKLIIYFVQRIEHTRNLLTGTSSIAKTILLIERNYSFPNLMHQHVKTQRPASSVLLYHTQSLVSLYLSQRTDRLHESLNMLYLSYQHIHYDHCTLSAN